MTIRPNTFLECISVTLGTKRPSYSTVKTWVSRFETGRLSTEDEERSGRRTKGTFSENVDAIRPMFLGDRRIFSKKMSETLAKDQINGRLQLHVFIANTSTYCHVLYNDHRHEVWICNRIYWTLTSCNYNSL
jgi:hypothetical protein